MMKKPTEKPVRLIAKSNKLIEARHSLDIWELRIFTKMLTMIEPHVNTLDYIIPIKEIITDFELSDSQTSYLAIREAAEKLLGRKVYIYKHIEGEKWERQATTLIKKYAVPVIKLLDGRFTEAAVKDKYIRIGFDEDVRDLIVNYKDSFTKLNLAVLAKLSPKSFRMYELLKQYEDTGFRTMTVDELRDIFDLTGQYKLYGSIKQRIIDKSQKDLDKYADIGFTYEEIKQGKAVYRLNFHIKSKNGKQRATPALPPAVPTMQLIAPKNPKLHDELMSSIGAEWGVLPTVLAQLCDTYPEERLSQAIEVTRHALKQGKVKESAAFFVEAVKKGYTSKVLEKEKKQATDAQEKKQKLKEKKALEQEKQALTEAYQNTTNNIVRELTAMSDAIALRAIEGVALENAVYFRLHQLDASRMSVEDFRKDKILRGWVIEQIKRQNVVYFEQTEQAYRAKLAELEEKIKRCTI